jgi:hypothetical protein
MIACILAQMIKSLCILQYRASALGECQEFIQLLLEQSFWNVMCPEGSPKFFPRDNMSRGLHGAKIIPPYAGSAVKLLGGKVILTQVRIRYSKESELRFNDMKPGIGIQRFFSLTKKWRLGTEEILLASHLGIEVITTSS